MKMRLFIIFIKNMLIAFGVISSFVTVSWAIFPTMLNKIVGVHYWWFIVSFAVISIGFGLFCIRQKKAIELPLSKKVKAKVYYGDLFTKEGIIIIPVNEYFDTLVDDKVIAINTLHGRFVRQFFGGDERNLKNQIIKSLNGKPFKAINEDRRTGNKKKYPLGTVAEVVKGNNIFYLVALTAFNENHRAEITNSEYQRVMCDLVTYINQHSQGRKVYLPLIGAGHSGVNLTKQKLLEFLLFSIYMNDNLTLINGVDIVLHDSIKDEINLSITEILFNSIEG